MEIRQKKRSEIADEFKWHINDLCPSNEQWHADMAAMTDKIAGLAAYRGRLAEADTLLACLTACSDTSEILERLYVYANMKLHEDANDTTYQGMADMAESTLVKFSSATSFIEPEILAADADTIKGYAAHVPGMALYGHYLDNLLRQKAHVMSAEVEEILANAREIGNASENIYSMLHDADMKFGQIIDEKGDTVEMTHGRFISLLESPDRRVREDAFNTYYDAYWKQKNTLAAAFNASVKKDVFFARTRKYPSALDAALFNYNIPREVYSRLIETVHAFLPEMHRYVRLRKKALGVSELHMYDLYTPIVKSIDVAVPYEEAKEKVLKGLAPLGGEYVATAQSGFENGWIDVYENEGKRSGAYSWGSYGCHPYVLLNYDNKLDDMFTLAHEMGHAMHSHYTWTTQPNVYGDYTIFLAEVASTVNEALLMEYLLAHTEDEAMRAYLINYFLEQFRTTVFRQTMFAEFEMITHDMVEKGEPLTIETLNKVYRALNVKYYGPDMVVDEKTDLEWGRIPHFYTAFYVYQYATGYSAAIAFANRILRGDGDTAVDAYIGFLKSGSSNYSIDILQKAGVDMSSPQPVQEALTVFAGLLDKMEALV